MQRSPCPPPPLPPSLSGIPWVSCWALWSMQCCGGPPSVLGVLAHALYGSLGASRLFASLQDGAGCLAALLRMRGRPTLMAADLKTTALLWRLLMVAARYRRLPCDPQQEKTLYKGGSYPPRPGWVSFYIAACLFLAGFQPTHHGDRCPSRSPPAD